MKTIQLKISDTDFKKYRLESQPEIKFPDLVQKISLEFARQALLDAHVIAKRTGLSEMTMEEIDAEIKAVRDAKNNS